MLIPFEKLFNDYNIKSKGLLHCGASTGQEADAYNSKGIEKVIWVEAIPEIYEELKINISRFPKNIAINSCISDVNGQEVNFNISNNDGQSSSFLDLHIHKEIHPSVEFVKSIKLTTSRLDTLLENYDTTGINFLNFDLQGAELLALKGLGERIRDFDYCYLEVNKRETYKGCGLIDEVDDYLKKFNINRVLTADWVSDTWSDAFYIKG
jgi:FkbM family methyltransferase